MVALECMFECDNLFKVVYYEIKMGELLKEVFHTQAEGLVGITEADKEILLDAPTPNALIVNITGTEYSENVGEKNKWERFLKEKDKKAKEKILQREEDYLKFEKRNFFQTGLTIYMIPYNKYPERK